MSEIKQADFFGYIPLFVLFILLGSSHLLIKKHAQRTEPFLNGTFPQELNVSGYRADVYSDKWENGYLTQIKGIPNSDFLLLLGKEGKIWKLKSYSKVETAELILDISNRVMSQSDAGLLNMEFHPNFGLDSVSGNRDIFIFYTYSPIPDSLNPLYDRLSKFRFSENLDSIISSSEEVLFSQFDRHSTHNGGALCFDNEGYLYVSVGDEGHFQDSFGNSQKINDALFSGVLRLDIDFDSTRSHSVRRKILEKSRPDGFPRSVSGNYLIPNDNPWVNTDSLYLEEFYAIGYRSPHSMTFDSTMNIIIVADVGQNKFEEINVLEKGSNAQWAYKEGNQGTGFMTRPNPIIGTEVSPIHFYPREDGIAVIGGQIYRGTKFPELNGKYLFGDYSSRNIWALDIQSQDRSLITILPENGLGLVGFHFNRHGDILMLMLDGKIYKLGYEISESPPRTLSEVGIFEDLGALSPKSFLLQYEVNSPLWSDNAKKTRWLILPDSEGIIFSSDSSWSFPIGTVIVKHFELIDDNGNPIRLETRFLVNDVNHDIYGLTYKWNDEGSEAFLINPGDHETRVVSLEFQNQLIEQTWQFPSTSQCLECHNKNAGHILGIKTSQINLEIDQGDEQDSSKNQITLWHEHGLFDYFPEAIEFENLSRLKSLEDTVSSVTDRVRSYLDSNCSHCHKPGGVEAAFDARFSTPLQNQRLICAFGSSRNTPENSYIIKPLQKDSSELWLRDMTDSQGKMPPIGRTLIDSAYLKLLEDWIDSLEPIIHSVQDSVCQGGTYITVDGREITNVIGEVRDTAFYKSEIGLDSLLITYITPIAAKLFEIDTAICLGDSFYFQELDSLVLIEEDMYLQATIKSYNLCDSIVAYHLRTKDCSVLEIKSLKEYLVFPNPSSNTANIIGSYLSDCKFTIQSMTGKQAKFDIKIINDDNIQIYHNLQPGMYLISVFRGSSVKYLPLLVN